MKSKAPKRINNDYFMGARDDHWDVKKATMTPEYQDNVIAARNALEVFKSSQKDSNK